MAAAGTLLIASPAAAGAQNSLYPPGAVVQPLPDRDAGEEVRSHLKTLAENPRSADALVRAGRAALAMGDADAAVSFFARADEVSPGDARVKAGMASALARMGQGQAALNLFGQAVGLGAPEIEIAGDRGLAFELVGDPASAQRDYARVLAARDDADVRRRLALSLAISGERAPALAAIQQQLHEQDRAAWRTRVFVLALTGDTAGAAEAARVTMPPGTAQAMMPFLARLAALTPAQKAMAVHLGHFPTNGGFAGSAGAAGADPGAVAFAQGGAALGGTGALPPRRPAAEPVSRAPRRRPGTADAGERVGPGTRPVPTHVRRRAEREAAATVQRREPVRTARNETPVPAAAAPAQPAPSQSAPQPAILPAQTEPGFEEVAAFVASLPVEASPPPAAATPAAAERPKPEPRAERPAASAIPSRHWVQIAGGADKAGLPREFARLAGLAPELLNGRAAWTTPLRFTNRLLVGPFESEAEAQAFVNLLAVKEVAAFAWTSPAGQEIQRLSVRR